MCVLDSTTTPKTIVYWIRNRTFISDIHRDTGFAVATVSRIYGNTASWLTQKDKYCLDATL